MTLTFGEAYLPATFTSPEPMSDEEFIEFCGQYPDYFLEMSAEGDILIMPPTDVLTSSREGVIEFQLRIWWNKHGRGLVSGPSGGFVLPNGARRSPDVAWSSRLPELTKKMRFPRFAPEFVVELRSPEDRLSRIRPKMREWVENGAELAWLVDPARRTVEVYRPGQEPEILEDAERVVGEGPVEGFVLDLRRVWDPPAGLPPE